MKPTIEFLNSPWRFLLSATITTVQWYLLMLISSSEFKSLSVLARFLPKTVGWCRKRDPYIYYSIVNFVRVKKSKKIEEKKIYNWSMIHKLAPRHKSQLSQIGILTEIRDCCAISEVNSNCQCSHFALPLISVDWESMIWQHF